MSNYILVSTASISERSLVELEGIAHSKGLKILRNPLGRRFKEEEIRKYLHENNVVGMIAGTEPLTGDVLESAKSLRVISRLGIGLDNVDLTVAGRLGITVLNTPDAPTDAVVELTIGLMLAQIRKISLADRHMRGGCWKPLMGGLLSKKTVGIIGLGRIGTKVGRILSAFNSKILFYDVRPIDVDFANQTSFEVLLKESDIVSLHMASLGEGKYILGKNELMKMKQNSILVNTSRGELIDEDALYDEIKKGHLGGAALDTFQKEPYEGKLLELPEVVFTCHMGSYAMETRISMETEAIRNLFGCFEKEVIV